MMGVWEGMGERSGAWVVDWLLRVGELLYTHRGLIDSNPPRSSLSADEKLELLGDDEG